MQYFISALLRGTKHFPELAAFINDQNDPNLGVELIAFTHDDDYWTRFMETLKSLSCPVSFHGPWVNIEATSPLDSDAHAWLIKSYDKVFRTAADHGVHHVVFHYSQLQFTEDTLAAAKANALATIDEVAALAETYGVKCLVENLCKQPSGIHLFTNEEYFQLFADRPNLWSIIDVGHAHVNGLDIETFLKTYGDRVQAYHFHNNDGLHDQHKSILDGTIDYEPITKWAYQYTPNAGIVLEYEPHVGASNDEILRHVELLKDYGK